MSGPKPAPRYLDPREACQRKAFFAQRSTAESAARMHGLKPYECPYCGLWHLTKRAGAAS